jgi:molybdate transport system substrate-binding protein
LDEVRIAFTEETGVKVVFSYASTAQLTQQIENSAPFDVFAAADTEHVDALIKGGKVIADSRAIYARGILALWIPKSDAIGVNRLEDLVSTKVRSIAIASPTAAPYGQAAVEALRKASLWTNVERKVVYSSNIGMAKQFAASGNADAAFTAYSLVLHEKGRVIRVDNSLYTPIDQAVGIVSATEKPELARQFHSFLLSQRARHILEKFGYVMQ